MTQNYVAGENIYFEYGNSKKDNSDKAYVANRDMTVQVELNDSHDDYPVSRVIKQEPNGNVVVQEVVDDHKFHSYQRNQDHDRKLGKDEEEDYEGDYNDDEYDYLHSICAYCQNDHRCDHDLQMDDDDDDEEYEYDDEEDEYEGDDDDEEDDEDDEDDYNDHDCQCPHHHLHYSHHHHHHHSQHYTNNDMSHRHHKSTNGVPRSSLLEKQKRIIKEQIQRPASGNFLWDFEYPEDIPDMIEFWIGLPYEKKRDIASIDFLKELDQVHDHQNSQGSCRLCGNRKSLIEKELEKLYNGYYNVRKLATESLDECDLNIETINTIFGIVEEEKIVEQEESTDALERELLSMADDLVKNNGENFISLIEQLDNQTNESRIPNSQPVSPEKNPAVGTKEEEPEQNHEDSAEAEEHILRNERVSERTEEEEENGEEENGEEEEIDDEDYEYDSDNESCSSGASENDYTSRKRLEETYKMLQIFSSKLLRKKVHDAFQAKRAEDISKSLLAEEEREAKLKKEKEEKEKKKKEKAKEKKRLQKLAKEEEKKRLEKEKEENERILREEQLRKTEEGRKRKEAERKKREEELKLKQEEKKRRKDSEMERLRKEKEEKERKRQEAKKQRDEEMKKKRDEKERKEKERQERQEKKDHEKQQQLLQKQKEEQEILEKEMAKLKLSQQKEKEFASEKPMADLNANMDSVAGFIPQGRNSMAALLNNGSNAPVPHSTDNLGNAGPIPAFLSSNLLPVSQSNLATPPHQFPQFDSTPVLESPSPGPLNLLNMRANTTSLYGSNVFNGSFGNDANGSTSNPLMNGNGLSNGLSNNLLNEDSNLFRSALFDNKSLSSEGTPKVNEGSIWNSPANALNNQPNESSVGRHNSIWSSGDISNTRAPSFSWSNPVATPGTDGLNNGVTPNGKTVDTLSIPQIELIQLESFRAVGRLPHISSGVYSVPLLYHYTKTLLASSIPSLTLDQFVTALSFNLGNKLNCSFTVYKDEKNEDVVKIVKGTGLVPSNSMANMNLGNIGMDMNYMNGLNVYNNSLNGLNALGSGLGNLPLNGINMLNMDGSTGEINLMNGLAGMNNPINTMNMNFADLNMNMGLNMGLNMNGGGGGGLPGLNPLQSYNNAAVTEAKDQPSGDRGGISASQSASILAPASSGNTTATPADTWKLF